MPDVCLETNNRFDNGILDSALPRLGQLTDENDVSVNLDLLIQ
jgi:hypothetical protein